MVEAKEEEKKFRKRESDEKQTVGITSGSPEKTIHLHM